VRHQLTRLKNLRPANHTPAFVTVIASAENMAWPEPRLSDRVWKAADVFGVVLGWAPIGWVLDHGVHLGPGGTVAVGFLVLLTATTD
jgi:hypothetical protein